MTCTAGETWSADSLHDLSQMSFWVLGPSDEQVVEPRFRWLDRGCTEIDPMRVACVDVVSPEDHRRVLAVGDRVEAVVIAGARFSCEPDSVPI